MVDEADSPRRRDGQHVVRRPATLPRDEPGGRDLHRRILRLHKVAASGLRQICRCRRTAPCSTPRARRASARWRRAVAGRPEVGPGAAAMVQRGALFTEEREAARHQGPGIGPGEVIPALPSDQQSEERQELDRPRDPDRLICRPIHSRSGATSRV